ncbi:MAG: DNA-3-methyladenine glycosylase [Anaerolineae bacterium]|nr:DNA-3-methyladenine glycosylase [Anaerolineae bacterium]
MDALALPRSFYSREPALVAHALIGKHLIRVLDDATVVCRIVETEAYRGSGDAASHAYRGTTARNFPMFGPPGHTYVYFIYGVHWMLNIAAHPEGTPGAVLIRAVEPQSGLDLLQLRRGSRCGRPLPDQDLTNGPAKLAQALELTGQHNDLDLCTAAEITVADGALGIDEAVANGPRVRVPGGEDAQARPWRFWIAGNPWVSR